jgi:hypothetical protein
LLDNGITPAIPNSDGLPLKLAARTTPPAPLLGKERGVRAYFRFPLLSKERVRVWFIGSISEFGIAGITHP